MPVPRKRHSRRRRDNRRAHIKLKVHHSQKCSHCSEPKRPHCVCVHCGFYKGREVIKQAEARA